MKARHFSALILAAAIILGVAGCSGATPATDFEYRYDAELGGVVIDGYTGSSINVKIPAKIEGQPVVKIGNSVFADSGIMEVSISNSVTTIGHRAFAGCNGLTNISIPDSVTSVGGGTFNGTPWLENQPDGIVYVGRVAYSYKGTMPPDTHLTFKKGTTAIGVDAFSERGNITSVAFDGLTSIGAGAFWGCIGMTSVVLPDSVTSVGESAFFIAGKKERIATVGGVTYHVPPPELTVTYKGVTYNAVEGEFRRGDGARGFGYGMPPEFYRAVNSN